MPRPVARFNRVLPNRILRPAARRLPGFGVVVHEGRSTGHLYETPVNVFDVPDGVLIPLVYGRESDWVSNVVQAGGCAIVRGGTTSRHIAPEIVGWAQAEPHLPRVVARMLGVVDVSDALRLRPEG